MAGRSAWMWVAIAASGCSFHVPAIADGGSAGGGVGGGGVVDQAAAASDDLAGGGADAAAGADLAPLAMPDLLVPADLATPAGELTVTRDPIAGTIELTPEGKRDWAHFGRNSASDVNRKAGGPAEIAVAPVGAALQQYNPYTPTTRWSDGTPTMNASTRGGVFVTGVDHAITLTVPADTTTRTLRAYLTHYQTTAQLVAHLSDGSAPDYSVALTTGVNSYYRVTVQFRAGSAGQTLRLTWTERADTANGFGSVDLIGASEY